jgi:hypothetical protein
LTLLIRRLVRLITLLGLGALPAGQAVAQVPHTMTAAEAAPPTASITVPPSYHITRVRVPMRDGARLDTIIRAPDDTSRTYPILLDRTPYHPAAPWLTPGPEFAKAKYIFVTQSVRGRYGSDGTFIQMRPLGDHTRSSHGTDESTDAYDTIDWLIKNVPDNNGRAGLWGLSYEGFFAAAGMVDAHPALKAVSPQAPQADWFLGDDMHHNGAFMLATAFNWIYMCNRLGTGLRICDTPVKPATDDGYKLFLSLGPLSHIDAEYLHGDSPEWQVIMRHGTYDELWQQRNLLPHLRNIRPAVLAVSGWYDASNLYGALHVFDTVRHKSPGTSARLVLGPWTHGEWVSDGGESIGPLHFGSQTATHFVQAIELPFFESYLKGEGRPDLATVSVFDTGLDRWSSFGQWPPKASVKANLYLGPRGSLDLRAQSRGGSGGGVPARASGSAAYDEYVSDPARPVPFVPDHGVDMEADYMTHDQRFTGSRSDVLTYESEPLGEDMTVLGPVSPHLVVSTSGTDSDWVVKLIDVHPMDEAGAKDTSAVAPPAAAGAKAPAGPGFEELVRGDVMRGKFRASFVTPSAMKPDEPTPIDFTMPDVYHTFKKGHRILVQVQSSWFPLVDRNPQRFEDIYTAKAGDFQRATQRVYHSARYPSRIELNLLPAGAGGHQGGVSALRARIGP